MHRKPNIFLIMADNLGAWPLGCYGNTEFKTPNLDKLAADGARFDQAYCVNPVCSPNRATLLTGLIPSQHGVHNFLGGEKPDAQHGDDAYCTIEEFPVLSQMLADEGYDCGLFGKWHLGDSKNPQCGFRDWFTLTRGHTPNFFKNEAWRDGVQYTETEYYPDVVTKHALSFLHEKRDSPFLLFLPTNLPYGLDRTLQHGHPGDEHFDADALTTCPKPEMHPWQTHYPEIYNSDKSRPGYAAEVAALDRQVGTLLDAIDQMGERDNTIVIFTSDHGLLAGQHGLWGMADHGRPCPLFQENVRIPLVIRDPQRIRPGTVVTEQTNHYDIFPYLVSELGLAAPQAHLDKSPGRDFSPTFDGKPLGEREFILHEYEHLRAIIGRRWKYVHRHPDGPHDLFDLQNDPGELNNLVDDPASQTKLAEMRDALDREFAKYVDPEYDLWNGGRSKAGLLPNPHGTEA